MNQSTSSSANTGITRSGLGRNHALITPESHVPIQLPGWQNTDAIVLISPELGAKFSQYLVHAQAKARVVPVQPFDQWFVLVQQGSLELEFSGEQHSLGADDYCYLPAQLDWQMSSKSGAQFIVFAKPYVSLAGETPPAPFVNKLSAIPAEPFLGDEDALLQVLLPDELAFDWGINLFEFVPGGTLPQVENHFMEHGLYLLAGAGVYRLGDDWYPVQAGDSIWMGPYLLQWYAATGKTNSRYIYYKEMHRAPSSQPR